MIDYFEFEKPIENINKKIESLSSNEIIDQDLIENYQKEKKKHL